MTKKLTLKSVLTRTLTGIVLVGVTVAAVYAGGGYTAAIFWLIMNAGLFEWAYLARQSGVKIPKFWLFVLSNVLYFLIVGNMYVPLGAIRQRAVEALLWIGVLLWMVFLALSIFKKGRNVSKAVSMVAGGCLYLGGSMALCNYLAAPFHQDGGHVLMGFFVVVWMGDVFAYLIGSAIGKHKLYERLSPSKSWEGALGGVVCAAAAGVLWGRLLLPNVDGRLWLCVSVLVPVAAIFGDLLESKFKRDAGVKDSGNVLPGHGGVLDRYDSVFLAAPFAVALWRIFSIL